MTRNRILPIILVVLAAFILGACDTIGQSIKDNPLEALQSLGRISEAAIKAGREITEEQEIYLGRSVSARLLSQYKLYNNSQLYKYVNMVGSTVAMVSDRPDLHFHFAILDTAEVNAFAAPGGYIFITRGMVKSMKNEDELAAILAHEIGHVCARHSLQSIKSDMWKRVAVITAQETARHSGVNPELLDLFGKATDKVVGTLVTVGYSQPMEFEADRLGQEYATRAGYDPQALRHYEEQMEKRAQGKDKTLSARLGTHPSFAARLEKLPPSEGDPPSPEYLKYRYARFKNCVR